MRCPDHIMGRQSENDASRGQCSVFLDGSPGREYANVIWGGEKGVGRTGCILAEGPSFFDSAIAENGPTCCDAFSPELITGNTLTLTGAPLCVRTYSDEQADRRFVMAFGQCFGRDWIHIFSDLQVIHGLTQKSCCSGVQNVPKSMANALSSNEYDCMWVNHIRLPRSTCIVRTCRIVWERSKIQIRIEVFHRPHFNNDLDEWMSRCVDFSLCPGITTMIIGNQ